MNLNEIKFVEAASSEKKAARSRPQREKKETKKNGRRNTPHDSGFNDANSRGDFDARERRLRRKAFLPL
jgi:hypothetical protein